MRYLFAATTQQMPFNDGYSFEMAGEGKRGDSSTASWNVKGIRSTPTREFPLFLGHTSGSKRCAVGKYLMVIGSKFLRNIKWFM